MSTQPIVTDEDLLSGGGTVPAAPVNSVAPNHPGGVKGFLANFLYGGGQALLQHAGLKTDDEKQEFAQRLGLQQYQADTARQSVNDRSQLLDAQANRLQTQADVLERQNSPYTFDKDDATVAPQFRGLVTTQAGAQAVRAISAKLAGAQGIADTKAEAPIDLAKYYAETGGNPKLHQIRSVGGRIGLYDRATGNLVKDIGADTALITGPRNAVARAQANAAYGVANTIDADGNPVAISRAEQLRTGAPTMTEKATQQLAGDKVGVATYLGASKLVEQNLSVLRDPKQKAIIARATDMYERDPGAFSAILNSSLQDGLSPEGAKLIGGLKQMNEFGTAFKKYTGNGGAATDSLRATIHSNQASAQNGEATNLQLIRQDRALAAQVGTILGKPGRYAVPTRPAAASAPTPAAPAAPAAPPGYELRDGPKGRGYYRK